MLSKISVKKPYTVLVGVLLVLILGVVSYTELTPDLLPSMDFPYVIVMTTYPGASPEEVEQTITKPVEQSMATLSNIKEINSTSSENYSLVTMEFEDTVNMDAVTIDVREGLDSISGAWSDTIGNPIIMKINPDMMPVMVAAVGADDMDVKALSDFASQEIIPKLEGVEGVASVTSSGLVDQSVNVVLRQDKIDEVNEKIKKAVEGELDDAEKKMNDAKKEIEDGKEELANQKETMNDGFFKGEQEINTNRLSMLKAEIEMASGKSELAAKEAELASTEKTLKQQESTLKKTEKTLTDNRKLAQSGLTKINAALKQIPSEKELEDAEFKLRAAILALDADTQYTAEQKAAAKKVLEEQLEQTQTAKKTRAELEKQKTSAEDGIAQIDAGLKEVASGKKQLSAAKKQVAAGKKALAKAKKKLNDGSNQLEQGKTALDQADSQLNQQKNEATEKVSEAERQLNEGESKLQEQLDNFDETKKTALDAADISGTITKEMISGILQAQNFDMPAGYVDAEGGESYLVRVGDKFKEETDMENLLLFDPDMDGVDPIYLSDVADVFWTDNSDETYAHINGNNGVMLTFQKQANYSTTEVADNISKKFDELEKEHENVHFTSLMDQGIYIHMIVDAVINNLVVGAILAVIILLLFLKDFRPALVIACSIPISVLFAIVLMYFSGVTLNMLSLSGLAIGVGMLVDNSVVAIENIYRLRNKGVPIFKAAVNGARQVAGALTSSTLTTICVFLPIVFIEGITRQLFTDMALTIAYSLLASLVVALTVVPSMSSTLLKKTAEKKHPAFDKMLGGYRKVLRACLNKKPILLIASVVLLVVSIVIAMSRGTGFMPDMDSPQITVSLKMPEDSILDETIEMSGKVEERIREIEDVSAVGAMISSGSMMMGGGETDVTSVSMYVILKDDKTHTSQEIAKQINEKCKDFDCEVNAEGSSMDMSALYGEGVAIKITGPELEGLQEVGEELAKKLEDIEGLDEISDGVDDPTPVLKVTVDKEKAMKKNLTVAQVFQALQSDMRGSTKATTLSISGTEYDINMVSDDESDLTLEDVKNYKVEYTTREGKKKSVKLSKIADIEETTSMSVIGRTSQNRYITVSASLKDGYNIGLVSEDVDDMLKDYTPPKGYSVSTDGENEAIVEAMLQMLKMLALALSFIYFIMVAQFQSLRSPFIVMFTIPLAFTGGFLGLFVFGSEVSVIAMLGFVMLSGIVVNNGIVLVDYINQLRMQGMSKREAIVEAGATRMRPILMTALTTIFGLSSMAFSKSMGADVMQPIVIVEIAGLAYATLTTLFVIPALYEVFNRKEEMKFVKDEDVELLIEE